MSRLRAAVLRLGARAAALYRREPARINTYAVGLVTAGALRLGFDVGTAAAVAVPLVLSAVAGELTRAAVTPTSGRAKD